MRRLRAFLAHELTKFFGVVVGALGLSLTIANTILPQPLGTVIASTATGLAFILVSGSLAIPKRKNGDESQEGDVSAGDE